MSIGAFGIGKGERQTTKEVINFALFFEIGLMVSMTPNFGQRIPEDSDLK